MAKGAVIMGLFLVIIVVVLAFFFVGSRLTGNVVNEDGSQYVKPSSTTASTEFEVTGFLNESSAYIEPPFYMNAWGIDDEKKTIILELMNNGNTHNLIKTIELAGCDDLNPNIVMNKGDLKMFVFVCSITGGYFERKVKVKYIQY